MDGRDFIKESPLIAWHNPFPPYVKEPSKKQKRGASKDAARRDSPSGSPPKIASSKHLTQTTEPQLVQYYIMNLPDSALTFLDAFWGLYTPLADESGFREKMESVRMPMICVYCFTREIEPVAAAKDIYEVSLLTLSALPPDRTSRVLTSTKRASRYLAYELNATDENLEANLHLVRSVAPKKDMYCLSFCLPRTVAFATGPYPRAWSPA